MIGVIANPLEHAAVHEFFELFKTPWEFYCIGRHYDVLLCAGADDFDAGDAHLIIIYASQEVPFDNNIGIHRSAQGKNSPILLDNGTQLPIYGEWAAFREQRSSGGVGGDCRSEILVTTSGMPHVTRIGYDLFREIHFLLTAGQPCSNAGIPTLELHIALLRDLIVSRGLPLIEIPPVPAGYRFIACLTHDVDHPSIRQHKFDLTMLGFLYRSLIVSVFNALRGRTSLRNLMSTWAAVFKLPFVYLGLAKDFWLQFTRYTEIENGRPSSFFVIPFRDSPGRKGHGSAPGLRASRYGVSDIATQIHELAAAGCEVGLHGIDAWVESTSAHAELEQIHQITGTKELGVRMHWLYFNEQSPEALEKAGANYDSTVGYNETVGYRAGTTQVFKPLTVNRLLELPLHIMDTALFFGRYLGLSPRQARQRIGEIIDHATQFGGALTVNWHDRSIAPERLWGDVYADVIADLSKKGAWFATAAQAVAWFRKRRSAVFTTVPTKYGLQWTMADDPDKDLPPLQLRAHNQTLGQNMTIAQDIQKRSEQPQKLIHAESTS